MILKRKNIIACLFCLSFFLNACQKNIDMIVQDPLQPADPNSTWYTSIPDTAASASLKNDLLLPVQRDSFQLLAGAVTVFGASSGLQFEITGGALTGSIGQSYFGTIYAETMLLKKKGDMIRMGLPSTSNGRILLSGGAFYARLSNNTTTLSVTPNNHITLTYADTPVFSSMKVFHGDQSSQPGLNWLPATDSIHNLVQTGNNFYRLFSSRLNWIQCGQFFDTTGIPQTKLAVDLPLNYTNANSIAYVSFDDMRSVTAMSGNAVSRKFISGSLPSNKQVTVIVISKQGNNYYLGYNQAFTALPATPGGTQNITVTPALVSLADVINFLGTL